MKIICAYDFKENYSYCRQSFTFANNFLDWPFQYYIGLTKTSGAFEWDGYASTQLQYSEMWNEREPFGDGYCVEIAGVGLNDYYCSALKCFLCEYHNCR